MSGPIYLAVPTCLPAALYQSTRLSTWLSPTCLFTHPPLTVLSVDTPTYPIPFHLPVRPICLSTCLSVYLYPFTCLSTWLPPTCLFTHMPLPVYAPVCPLSAIYPSTHIQLPVQLLSVCPSTYLLIYPDRQFTSLSKYLFINLSSHPCSYLSIVLHIQNIYCLPDCCPSVHLCS